MAAKRTFKVFGTKDARIRRMLTDEEGSAPTYGPWIDVPGIKSCTIGGTVSTSELRGDNKRLDYEASLGGVSVSFEYSRLSLEVLSVLLGGDVTGTPETTANAGDSQERFALNGDDRFNYFEFQAVSATAEPIGADVMFSLSKCILSDFPEMGTAEEDYQTFSVPAEAMDPLGDADWLAVTNREAGGLLVNA